MPQAESLSVTGCVLCCPVAGMSCRWSLVERHVAGNHKCELCVGISKLQRTVQRWFTWKRADADILQSVAKFLQISATGRKKKKGVIQGNRLFSWKVSSRLEHVQTLIEYLNYKKKPSEINLSRFACIVPYIKWNYIQSRQWGSSRKTRFFSWGSNRFRKQILIVSLWERRSNAAEGKQTMTSQ